MNVVKRKLSLTEQADKLSTAIRALGTGWHGAAEIAKQLGKSRLNPYDTAALDLLVLMDMAEVEIHEIDANISQRHEWRLKE
jgi:hypothetical protein